MTSEKLYAMTIEMMEAHERLCNLEGYTKMLLQNPLAKSSLANDFFENARLILVDCLDKMETIKPSAKSALNRLYKDAVRKMGSHNGFYKDYSGLWTLLDGHRIVRLVEKPVSIPEFSTDNGREPWNTENIMKIDIDWNYHVSCGIDLSELKAWTAAHKKDRLPFILDDYIGFNSSYMYDALSILENPVVYLPNNNRSPIYIKGDNGDALVLPVNIGKRVWKDGAVEIITEKVA